LDVVSTTLRACFQDFTPAEHLLGHMFEKVRRVWGGEKNGKIYLIQALKYIFLFMSKTGCFRLRVIFQGLKTVRKCKIGSDLVRFELKTAKRAKSIGRASYAEAKKSAERSSKRRIELQKGGWHFVYFT